VPLAFVSITTLTAGVLSVRDNFWPMAIGPDVTTNFQGWINTSLTIVMMISVVVILGNAIWKWRRVLSGVEPLRLPAEARR
jgi:carbon starvation protein CstA